MEIKEENKQTMRNVKTIVITHIEIQQKIMIKHKNIVIAHQKNHKTFEGYIDKQHRHHTGKHENNINTKNMKII